MSEAALLESLVESLGSNSDVVRAGAVQPTVPQPDATPLPSDFDPFTNPPSPTKRRASLESDIPTAKRIKVEPRYETGLLPSSEPVETSISSPAGAMMTTSLPGQPAAAHPSVTTTTAAESLPPADPAMVSMSAAPMASGALAPPIPSSALAPAHTPTPTPGPMATPTAADTPAAPTPPIPSIEKSPSVNLEPGKYTASPGPTKDNATPEVQMANTETPAATTAPPPRKRRRMLEAPGQALRGMNMQLLGIQAVQVLEWLSQEPFEDVIDALRDFESEVYASYSFKVAQFEQAWRNFSATEDLLEWSRMGLGDQKHRKTVRLANLARFAIDLFSEDESCLPSLHERFYRVFVYGTRKFTLDHSNILLELKTQLALYLLTEGDKEKAPADVLQEVFLGGLQAKLQERCWNLENFNEETAMMTSAEIRMSLLLHEFEESGGNTMTLAERYPLDSLLRQLGSYMHGELVAHSDHCQTLVFSSRTAGKGPAEPRSLAYQDDDDYWQRTTKLIDDMAASITADFDAQAAPVTSEILPPEASAQPSTTSNGTAQNQSLQAGLTNSPTPSVPVSEPVELGEQLRGDIDRLKEFMNQKIASREAEIARASLPPTPLLPPVPLDPTAQNLYLLNKATQPQQPQYTQRGSATPQTPNPTPMGVPHVPIPGHPQGHVPRLSHPIGDAPNQMPGQGQPTEQPLAPGELPPNQTCPTSMLYDKARQAALSKSATHTRREGIHSTRRPWTPEEEKALMTGLDMVKGPHWSQILSLFGPNGTISDVLKDRTQVQLKDKARNLKLFFLKTQSEMPYYLSAVTGELKTRAPNQAARKEAEERARLSREEEQVKAQGTMAALPGQMQSSSHVQGGQGGVVRPPHTGVVTPAQAALAAQITTPAMAQGQAQSGQRPIQAAHPSLSTMPAKEAQAATPITSSMVAPSPASMHGGAMSAPVAHSQPHNRPSDGTVAALQELARASAISSLGTPSPRMSSQAPAQAQGQIRNGATAGFQNTNQGQGQHRSPAPQAHQAHQTHQSHQAHQPHQSHQAQGQVAQARLHASSSPQPRPQMPVQLQGQNQAPARISASPGLSGQVSTPTVTTPAPTSTVKSAAMPSPAPTTQAQAPPAATAPSAATTRTQPSSNAAPSTRTQPPPSNPPASSPTPPASALAQLQAHQNARSTPMTLSQSFPSTIPANLFSRVTEAEATNSGLLEKLRAEMARDTRG